MYIYNVITSSLVPSPLGNLEQASRTKQQIQQQKTVKSRKHIYTRENTVKPVYSGHFGTQKTVLYFTGSLIHIHIAMGPQLTVLIIEVSLSHRFIYTHLYCNGTTTDCPYYRGVLILECPQ